MTLAEMGHGSDADEVFQLSLLATPDVDAPGGSAFTITELRTVPEAVGAGPVAAGLAAVGLLGPARVGRRGSRSF